MQALHLARSDQATDPLADYAAMIAALPRTHVRCIGLWCMRIGMAALLAFLCLGIVTMHVAFVLVVVGFVLARPPIHRLPGFYLGCAFAAWQMISMLACKALGAHGLPWRIDGTMHIWLALYFGQVAFREPAVRRWALVLTSITVGCSALLALAQFVIGFSNTAFCHLDPHGERFHLSVGFAPVHLTQGFIMSLLALVLLASRALAPGLPAWSAWSGRCAALVAMVISSARLVYIAFPLGLSAGVAAGGRRRWLRAVAILCVIGTASALLLAWLWPARFHEMVHGQDGRWAIWRASTAVIAEHPWIGTGDSDAFKAAFRDIYPRVVPDVPMEFKNGASHAHNSLLTLAAEHGVPTAVLYLLFLAAILWPVFRRRAEQRERWSLAVALTTATLVAGIFENLISHSAPAYASFVTLGLCLGLGADRAAAPDGRSTSPALDTASGVPTPA